MLRFKKQLITCLFLGLALAGNAFAESPAHGADHGASHDAGHNAGHGAAHHWGYQGEGAPSHWGDLDPEFKTCKVGKAQSPIDLVAATMSKGNAGGLKVNYSKVPLVLTNNGHTLQVDYQPGSTLTLGDKSYELLQFHFHNTSEHTLNGKSFPLEVHFVHKNAQGQLAVVGAFVEEGAENAALKAVFAKAPKEVVAKQTIHGESINGADVLPANKEYMAYTGSLTTPPCTEAVSWNVLTTPVKVSKAQIAQFETIYRDNYRPVQALNGRAVILNK